MESWPDWAAPLVLISGPPLSGKTHLARVWANDTGATFLHGSQLGTGSPAVVAGEVRLAVIDGLDQLNNEEALFHLINAIYLRGGSVLLTSRVPASGLELRLADLKTRLKSAVSAEIGPPDEPFLLELMAVLAEEAQIAIDPAVAAYCLARMERTQEAAVNLISALNRRSLALQGPLTQRVAADVLDELSRR